MGRFYDVRSLGRAFYSPGRRYAYYRDRVGPIIKGIPYFTRWYEFEQTWPQSWTTPAGRRSLKVLTNAPVMLIPVTPWFDTPFLEGKSVMWKQLRLVLSQRQPANGIRAVHAPLVTIGMFAGTGAGIYSGVYGAAGWLNASRNGTAAISEPDREL